MRFQHGWRRRAAPGTGDAGRAAYAFLLVGLFTCLGVMDPRQGNLNSQGLFLAVAFVMAPGQGLWQFRRFCACARDTSNLIRTVPRYIYPAHAPSVLQAATPPEISEVGWRRGDSPSCRALRKGAAQLGIPRCLPPRPSSPPVPGERLPRRSHSDAEWLLGRHPPSPVQRARGRLRVPFPAVPRNTVAERRLLHAALTATQPFASTACGERPGSTVALPLVCSSGDDLRVFDLLATPGRMMRDRPYLSATAQSMGASPCALQAQ